MMVAGSVHLENVGLQPSWVAGPRSCGLAAKATATGSCVCPNRHHDLEKQGGLPRTLPLTSQARPRLARGFRPRDRTGAVASAAQQITSSSLWSSQARRMDRPDRSCRWSANAPSGLWSRSARAWLCMPRFDRYAERASCIVYIRGHSHRPLIIKERKP